MARERIENIDGLRGLAAISVIFGHSLEMMVKNFHLPPILHTSILDGDLLYFSPGRLGVVAFFCISGLVIPFSFSGEKPLINFLISRFFRLYPAYWFSLAVALLILPNLGAGHFNFNQIIANISMIQFALKQKDILGVYWTLFIEILFYTICFFSSFARILHSRLFNFLAMSVFTALALAGGAYRYTHPMSTISIGVFTYLAAMHFGTLTRILYLEGQRGGRRLFAGALTVLLVGVIAANTLGYVHAQDKTTGWVASNTSYVFAIGLFLACVRFRLFRQPTLLFFGAISYSLYLIHPIFIEISQYYLGSLGAGIAAPLSFLIITGGSFTAATLMRKLIEQPAIRVGKRISRSLGKGHTSAGPIET